MDFIPLDLGFPRLIKREFAFLQFIKRKIDNRERISP